MVGAKEIWFSFDSLVFVVDMIQCNTPIQCCAINRPTLNVCLFCLNIGHLDQSRAVTIT